MYYLVNLLISRLYYERIYQCNDIQVLYIVLMYYNNNYSKIFKQKYRKIHSLYMLEYDFEYYSNVYLKYNSNNYNFYSVLQIILLFLIRIF